MPKMPKGGANYALAKKNIYSVKLWKIQQGAIN